MARSFAGAWPDREAAGGEDAGFAKELGDLRKIVATHGMQDLGWRAVERSNDVVAAAKALREEGVGKVLVAGSISIVRQLLAAGQLDELRLLIHPVAAGTGERLFAEGAPMQHLSLVSAEALPTGMLRTIFGDDERWSKEMALIADHWRQLGNEGWSYEDVLPFFKKAENNERGGDQFHGEGRDSQ